MKKKKYTITISDLPEDMTEEELKKVQEELASSLDLASLAKITGGAGDCDCWGFTACGSKKMSQM